MTDTKYPTALAALTAEAKRRGRDIAPKVATAWLDDAVRAYKRDVAFHSAPVLSGARLREVYARLAASLSGAEACLTAIADRRNGPDLLGTCLEDEAESSADDDGVSELEWAQSGVGNLTAEEIWREAKSEAEASVRNALAAIQSISAWAKKAAAHHIDGQGGRPEGSPDRRLIQRLADVWQAITGREPAYTTPTDRSASPDGLPYGAFVDFVRFTFADAGLPVPLGIGATIPKTLKERRDKNLATPPDVLDDTIMDRLEALERTATP